MNDSVNSIDLPSLTTIIVGDFRNPSYDFYYSTLDWECS